MLSKVLATLVATTAVAFAGYSLVCDRGSHCCSGSLPTAISASSESSCCESAAPSCCDGDKAAVTTEAACTDVCPASKAAAGTTVSAPATEAPK